MVPPAAGLTADPVFRRWFPTARPTGAETRLFCLPHAGAGASSYRDWFARLGPGIDCLPVQLPGRETRIAERPLEDIDELVSELAPVLAAHGGPRFALFGHSMGALIAYVTAHAAARRPGAAPVHLFVSGASAPRHERSRRGGTRCPTAPCSHRLAELGGMPDGVLAGAGAVPRCCCPSCAPISTLCERYVHPGRSPSAVDS